MTPNRQRSCCMQSNRDACGAAELPIALAGERKRPSGESIDSDIGFAFIIVMEATGRESTHAPRRKTFPSEPPSDRPAERVVLEARSKSYEHHSMALALISRTTEAGSALGACRTPDSGSRNNGSPNASANLSNCAERRNGTTSSRISMGRFQDQNGADRSRVGQSASNEA